MGLVSVSMAAVVVVVGSISIPAAIARIRGGRLLNTSGAGTMVVTAVGVEGTAG